MFSVTQSMLPGNQFNLFLNLGSQFDCYLESSGKESDRRCTAAYRLLDMINMNRDVYVLA